VIVPMKKVWILSRRREEEGTLELLGRTGVLHLESVAGMPSHESATLREEMALLGSALELCGPEVEQPVPAISEGQILERARRIRALEGLLREDESRLHEMLETQTSGPGVPGLNISELEFLEQRGIHLSFRRVLKEDLAGIPHDVAYAVVQRAGQELILAVFSRKESLPKPMQETTLALRNPAETERLVEAERTRLIRHRMEMKELQTLSGSFRTLKARLEDRLSFETARAAFAHEGPVSIIVGYCPSDRVREVEQMAEKGGWALLVQDPDRDDPVPTLLRPSRTGGLFAPVLKILSVLPGYREGDPSGLLAPFFALFTAMLLDDAGYGLLLLVAALFFREKLRRTDPDAWRLLLTLGGATMAWGALHGSWFGLGVIADHPVARLFVLDIFRETVPGARESAIRLCLIIGVIHLSAARVLNAFRYAPSRATAAETGWIVFLWGMYGLIDFLLLGGTAGWPEAVLMGGGFLIAVLFGGEGRGRDFSATQFARNIPLVILNGLGSLSDIVSYLRLFAVGLASRMLAQAFNDLAAGAFFSDYLLGPVLGALIFAAGHVTNVLLAAMAVLVHGVRLNLLEFSKHAGTEWAGISYRPFAFKSRRTWEGARP